MGLQGQEVLSRGYRRRGYRRSCCRNRNAHTSLNLLAVTKPLSGLKHAGHDVVILEQVPQIGEVGAGIQIAPNAARILGRFGLLEKIMGCANVLEKNSLRRWQNNEEIGTAPLMPKVRATLEFPTDEC